MLGNTEYRIIKSIGLNDYYGERQKEAEAIMEMKPFETFEIAFKIWQLLPTPATREFIGRVLTGIHKENCRIDEIK